MLAWMFVFTAYKAYMYRKYDQKFSKYLCQLLLILISADSP